MAYWYEAVDAIDAWPDFLRVDDALLADILEAARVAVSTYGGRDPEPGAVPQPWRVAQLLQARNIWNSAYASPGSGGMGGDDYSLTTFPLDWQVRELIRPKAAVPVVL